MYRVGFKAMYKDKCINQQYKVGYTYKLEPNVQLQIKNNILGFHYCVDPNEVVYYYDIKDKDFELYEVHDMNPNNLDEFGRYVTDEIKIVRKIERNEYDKIFTKSYFELVGISRIYVWKNMVHGNYNHMIKNIKEYK